MSFDVSGMENLLSQLTKMSSNADAIKEAALDAGAEHLRAKIAENTPRSQQDKEHAADNVIVEKNGDVREIGYSKDHFYMMFRELGTSKQTAKPIVRPTYENEIDTAKTEMVNVVKRGMGL